MVILAGSTGLRRSELVALTWSDIDLELMQVNVRRSCVRNHFGDTKTEASRKPVPLHPSVAKTLAAMEEGDAISSRQRLRVSAPSGCNGKKPVTPDMVLKKMIRPALERAGITDKVIGWHSFRHSLATNLRAAGRRFEDGAGTASSRQLADHAGGVHAGHLLDQAGGQ